MTGRDLPDEAAEAGAVCVRASGPLTDTDRQAIADFRDRTAQFHARATIAELMQFGGLGVRRELAKLTRDRVEDITVELVGLFAALYPGDAPEICRWWRLYAETGSVDDADRQCAEERANA